MEYRTGDQLYVLVVDHKHGVNVSLHLTDVDANIAVAAFAREWWEQDGPKRTPPTEASDLISRYFDASGESWMVDEVTLP